MRLQVCCGSHSEKTAVLSWSGDFKTEYLDDGLSQWDDMRSCQVDNYPLEYKVMPDDTISSAYGRVLGDVLANAVQEFQLPCGHEMTPQCMTCAKEIDEKIQLPDNDPIKETETDSIDGQLDGKATAEGERDAGRDETVVNAELINIGACDTQLEEETSAKVLKLEVVDALASASEVAEIVSEKSTKQELPGEVDPVKKIDPVENVVPIESRLTKEAKAQRSATLKEEQKQRKAAHDKEVEDMMEEIAYQKEILRSRREQKRQEQKLKDLQQKLGRLSRKVAGDSDYNTDDSNSDSDDDDTPADSQAESISTPAVDTPVTNEDQESPDVDEAKPEDEPQKEPEDPNAFTVAPSKAKQEWEAQKKTRNESNETLDTLMDLIGLESVKTRFMEIKNLVDTARRQDVELKKERFGTVLIGNPGSGKTKVAELYASFLSSLEIAPSTKFATRTGAQLANDGIDDCKKLIENVESYYGGGVILVDEAHQLLSDGSSSSTVLDFIISEIDRLQGVVVFIFAGYMKPMESFLGYSPGLRSRIPFTIKFDDYDETELHQILVHKLKDKFGGKMRVEGGINGLYMRIVARRIGRGRGSSSFGNAREVHNTLNRVLYRQASRLEASRRLDEEVDDFFLTRIDLIGPPPSTTLDNSKAWRNLQSMIGLDSVKEAVQTLIDRLQVNYDRELAEQPLVGCSLNKVFIGNPGTGKTTVAKYYGQILVDIGLLSNGEVIIKNPSDFIGSYLGDSENITNSILESTRGKVLIIDEAYALSDASEDTGMSSSGNSYKSAVVDTLVSEIQSTATEDRCVLLLGYKDKMVTMFQSVNPGLSRRFPMSSAFEFEDYTNNDLRQILDQKLEAQGFTAQEEAKKACMECLERARNHKNFGNAGEIDILLDKAKELQQKRFKRLLSSPSDPSQLEPQDFDIDFDRVDRAEANIRQLFSNFVGAENLIERLEGYQRVAQNSKALDMDPRTQVPFNFLFRGPPGTGKTTTARRMGQVFYEMGFLATNEVVDCSATDLVGEFVGQTGPKTHKLFQKALGKVLFIDEAYRLADCQYGKEAMVEMMNILTKDQYKNKLITILAGYDEDINQLLDINPGLSSRFPEVISFTNLAPNHCYELFIQELQETKLDTTAIEANQTMNTLMDSFQTLAKLPAWGNARDIQTLVKAIFGKIMKSPTSPPIRVVTSDIVYSEITQMILEREKRAKDAASVTNGSEERKLINLRNVQSRERNSVSTAPVLRISVPVQTKMFSESRITELSEDYNHYDTALEVPKAVKTSETDLRERGVSDEVWEALQEAKSKAKERLENLERLRARIAALKDSIASLEEEQAKAETESTDTTLEDLRKDLKDQESVFNEANTDAETEKKVQNKLMYSGMCYWGCPWVREAGGYRCSAGACFKSHEDIRREYGIS